MVHQKTGPAFAGIDPLPVQTESRRGHVLGETMSTDLQNSGIVQTASNGAVQRRIEIRGCKQNSSCLQGLVVPESGVLRNMLPAGSCMAYKMSLTPLDGFQPGVKTTPKTRQHPSSIRSMAHLELVACEPWFTAIYTATKDGTWHSAKL